MRQIGDTSHLKINWGHIPFKINGMCPYSSQSVLEYVVLLCVILSSLLIMQVYVKRAYQGRLKQEADTLGQQYAPTHTISSIETITNTSSVSFTGGETSNANLNFNLEDLVPDAVAVPDGMTVSFSDTQTNFVRDEKVDSFATED